MALAEANVAELPVATGQSQMQWRAEQVVDRPSHSTADAPHGAEMAQRGARLADLDEATYDELWRSVRMASAAIRTAFRPEGLNVGINEGSAGGGSEPDHLHVHVVPRWNADTNFMTAVAETRILPVSLYYTWKQLREAWPDSVPFPA